MHGGVDAEQPECGFRSSSGGTDSDGVCYTPGSFDSMLYLLIYFSCGHAFALPFIDAFAPKVGQCTMLFEFVQYS